MNLDELDIKRLRQRSGEKWSHYPDDVLPAWVADMDFDIAAPIREAVEQRLALSDCGYPVAASETGLLEIFCERVGRRFDWRIEPGQVQLFSDVVQAIYFGLLGLADKGDGVVIQTPIYPPFLGSTNATGRRPVLAPLQFCARGFEIDFDQLRDSIDGSTKILLLCNPHNPSGRCFSRAELEQLAELALTFDLSIISDEIHADLVFTPHRHIPIASLSAEVAERTVTLMSASKAFNIAGICLAFAVFGGDRVRSATASLPAHVRGGVSALSLAAVGAAFSAGQPWLDEVLAYLQQNRDYLAAYAKQHWPDVRHVAPDATYLGWFDFSACELPGGPYRYFLDVAKVALGDGARFGDPGRGCARINFATSRPILEQITARMTNALNDRA
jgi:cystathionine beta-lyase